MATGDVLTVVDATHAAFLPLGEDDVLTVVDATHAAFLPPGSDDVLTLVVDDHATFQSPVSPFSPADLSPVVWLRPDQGVYQDAARTTPATVDGNPVGGQSDQSGNSNHAGQSTSGARPTLQLAETNGQAVLRFDGSDDYLSNSTLSLSQPYTMSCIVRFATPTDGVARAVFDSNSGFSLTFKGTGNALELYAGGSLPTGSTSLLVSEFLVLTTIMEGMSSRLYLNGALEASGDAGANGLTGYRLALVSNDTAPGNIDLGDVVVCSGALGDTDRGSLETYLATRYGVTF